MTEKKNRLESTYTSQLRVALDSAGAAESFSFARFSFCVIMDLEQGRLICGFPELGRIKVQIKDVCLRRREGEI